MIHKLFKKKAKEQPEEVINPEPEEEQSEFNLRTVYKDKFGNTWKEFENNLDLPASRAIAAEIAAKHAEFNIDAELLKEMIATIKNDLNQGKIVDAFHLFEEIEIRLEMIGEEKTLLDLCCCYYLLNDEEPNSSGQSTRKEKLEILDNDFAARSFFLQRSFEFTKNFSNILEEDILKFLKEQRPVANRLQDLISKKKSRNTLIR